MLLKAVIAEDDDLFRQKLINVIAKCEGIEVAYSTDNGKELLNMARKIKPEIIITDIDMPFMTGIDAIKAIRDEIPYTEIIFITLYDQYIKDAIKLYAFDYIEKECNINRLIESIERIKSRYAKVDKMIYFKTEDSTECVRVNDLFFVEAYEKKTKVYTTKGIFVCSYSLLEVEHILDKAIFYKSSRYNIINLSKIDSVKPHTRRILEIRFVDKDWKAYLSKANQEEFRKRINNLFNDN